MGLLDDLQMGLGLKDRNKDYYKRTAKTISNSRGEAAGKRYLDRMNKAGMSPKGGLLSGMNMGGYRDMNDMFDGGGPMARGGQYEGGGLLSFLGNLANALTGRDMGDKVGYGAPMEATMKPKAKMMPSPEKVNGYYPDMAMMDGQGFNPLTEIPYVVGGGFNDIASNAYPKAVAPSMSNTAKTTTGQDFLYEIATDTVVKRLSPEGFGMMPPEERRALIDQEYTKIVSAIEL